MASIFDSSEAPIGIQTFGGYRPFRAPLQDGYGEYVGDPDHKGDFELVTSFFCGLSPEQIQQYTEIAEVAIDPPAQDALTRSIYGFSTKEYAHYLALGVKEAGLFGYYAEANTPITKRLEALRFWFESRQATEYPIELIYERVDRNIPDSYEYFWHPSSDTSGLRRISYRDEIKTLQFMDLVASYSRNPKGPAGDYF